MEPDGVIDYVVYYDNNSVSAADVVMLDTMPYNGINGSHFTGSYSVNSWKLDVTKCAIDKLKFYYTIESLDAGTYYLKETEAPAGYNKLNTVVTVIIDHDGKINATTEKPEGATQSEVENKSGTELPSTGGMGTTIFYVLGSVLVVGAVVLLVTKKRMSTSDK